MSNTHITQFYRSPFYVVRNDLNKINGLFVFLPGLLYDSTVDALNQDPVDKKSLEALYGPNWKTILEPDLEIWVKSAGSGPVGVDIEDHFYEPLWPSDAVKFHEMSTKCTLIRLGILIHDNFMQIRRKIMSVMNVGVVEICLSTTELIDEYIDRSQIKDSYEYEFGPREDSLEGKEKGFNKNDDVRLKLNKSRKSARELKEHREEQIRKNPWMKNVSQSVINLVVDKIKELTKVVSDVVIDSSELISYKVLNPFDKQTYPNISSQIGENISLLPSTGFVYATFLYDYYIMLNESGIEINPHRDIFTIFPAITQTYYDIFMADPGTVHTTPLFNYTPANEYNIQQSRDHFLQNGILLNQDINAQNVRLTEVATLLMFTLKKNVPVSGIDIVKSANEIVDRVDFTETNQIINGKEILSNTGVAIRKSTDLVDKTTPKITRGFEWVFSAFNENKQLLGFLFIDQFGNTRCTFKFSGVEYGPYKALDEIKKSVAKRFPKEIIDENDLNYSNISSMTSSFYLEKTIPIGSFNKCKDIVVQLKSRFIFEVSELTSSVIIKFPNLMLPNRESLKEVNSFEKWNLSAIARTQGNFSQYKYVEIEMQNFHTQLKFYCPNIPWQMLPYVRQIISFICGEIDKVNLKSKVSSKTISNTEKSKKLSTEDRKRFKFGADKGSGNYSQRCQAEDQPQLLTEEEYNNLSAEDRKRAIVMINLTTGKNLYLLCPKTRPYGVFMINVHPQRYIDPETGEEFIICMPCCRKSDPKSTIKQNINKVCREKGIYPVKNVMPVKRVTHILMWTMRNYVDRIMNIYPLFASIIGSNKYFVYGPPKDNTINGLFVNAVVEMMHKSISLLNEEIMNFLMEDVAMVSRFAVDCDLDKNIVHNALLKKSLLFELNVIIEDISQLVMIYTYLLERFYNAHLFIFGDGVVCNVSRFALDPDDKIYMIYQHKDVFFPIIYLPDGVYNGNFNALKFDRTPSDTMFQTMKAILEKNHKDQIAHAEEVLSKISAAAVIVAYYKNLNKGIYGVEIEYGNSSFYFPIPITTKSDVKIWTHAPQNFAEIRTAIRFLDNIGEKATALCASDGYIFALKIFDSYFFIKEDNIEVTQTIRDSTTVIEEPFDKRRVVELLGDNIVSSDRNVDDETYQIGRSEIGKQITFNFFTLIICRHLVKDFASEERLWIKKVISKGSSVLPTIFAANNLTNETKLSVAMIISGNHSINDTVFQEDFNHYSTFSLEDMTKIITDVAKNLIEVVPDDSQLFEELLDREVYSNSKLYLTKNMYKDYPKELAKIIINKSVGDLIVGTTRNIYSTRANAMPRRHRVKDIAHVRTEFKR